MHTPQTTSAKRRWSRALVLCLALAAMTTSGCCITDAPAGSIDEDGDGCYDFVILSSIKPTCAAELFTQFLDD